MSNFYISTHQQHYHTLYFTASTYKLTDIPNGWHRIQIWSRSKMPWRCVIAAALIIAESYDGS